MPNTNWGRDNGNGHFPSSLENTLLSHFQSKTLKNSRSIYVESSGESQNTSSVP